MKFSIDAIKNFSSSVTITGRILHSMLLHIKNNGIESTAREKALQYFSNTPKILMMHTSLFLNLFVQWYLLFFYILEVQEIVPKHPTWSIIGSFVILLTPLFLSRPILPFKDKYVAFPTHS